MRKPSRSLSNRLINPTKRFATPAEGLEMMTKRFGMPVRYAGFAIRRNSWYRICNPNCPRGVADYNRLLRPTVPQRLITADCKSAVTNGFLSRRDEWGRHPLPLRIVSFRSAGVLQQPHEACYFPLPAFHVGAGFFSQKRVGVCVCSHFLFVMLRYQPDGCQ